MDRYLLDLLVCPLCKGKLYYDKPTSAKPASELICRGCRLAYPVHDEIPVMLAESARKISLEEYDQL